jgi:Phage endonuclease I
MGLDVDYETTNLPYTTKHTYTPDFTFVGTNKVIEYKGNGRAFDNAVRQKMVAVKEQYPELEFFIVFHTDGKIGPKRKNGSFLKQSDWAIKNGFRFCIGVENIPADWFE